MSAFTSRDGRLCGRFSGSTTTLARRRRSSEHHLHFPGTRGAQRRERSPICPAGSNFFVSIQLATDASETRLLRCNPSSSRVRTRRLSISFPLASSLREREDYYLPTVDHFDAYSRRIMGKKHARENNHESGYILFFILFYLFIYLFILFFFRIVFIRYRIKLKHRYRIGIYVGYR